MKFDFDKRLILFFVSITIGTLVIAALSYQNQQLYAETSALVEHTQDVIYESEKIISYTKEFGNGIRGYLISRDSTFLRNYLIAMDSIGPTILRFKSLTKDKPLQQARADSLEFLINHWIGFSQRVILLINKNGERVASDSIASLTSLGTLNSIRSLISKIQKDEKGLLLMRKNSNEESARTANLTFYLLIASMLLVLIISFYIIRQDYAYRKEAEQELHHRNELFSQTLVGLGDGVISTDANGIVTFLNNVACELTGWSTDEAVGTHIAHIFKIKHEKTGLTVINPVMEAIQRNRVVYLSNHTVLTGKDGRQLFIDDSGAPIHNLNGKTIGGVLVFRDVSERKRVEDEIRANEEKFRAYFDNSMAGILFTAPDGRIFNANPAACHILGMTEAEICALGRDAIADVTDPQFQQFLEYRLRDGKARGEMTMIRKDGTRFIADVASAEFTYQLGEQRTCLIFEDITERKKAESLIRKMNQELESKVERNTKEIIESEARYRYALDHMMEGIQIIDFDWKYLYLNKEALLQSTFTLDQLVGRTMMEVYSGIEHTALFKVLEQSMKSRKSAHLDNEFVFPDKSSKWFELSIQPVPEGLFILSSEITDRKLAEQKLKEHNVALKKANEELDRFVYSVSHDLRAPLTSLLGLISITQKDTDPSSKEQIERLKMMKRSVNRLDNFIADILDYSRNARTPLSMDTIDFNLILAESLEHSKYLVAETDCNLSFTVKQKHVFTSDVKRIKIILNNLISNGIKYRDLQKKNAFVTIHVKVSEQEAMIEVEDNGIGIAKADQKRIFKMFERVSIQGSGSGIGLYIVKETVEKLRGTIEVKSTINKGSSFTIIIPNEK